MTPGHKPTILTIQPDFTMRGYYSVFNPRGEKIADCGAEKDAVNLMSMRNRRWDGHYFTFIPLPGDIVDITRQLKSYEHINDDPQDGWFLRPEYQDQLPQNQQEPLRLDDHDC